MPTFQSAICEDPDQETHRYVLNHTMLRIKDVGKSLDFYTRVLGMKVIYQLKFQKWKFTLFFLQARGNGQQLACSLSEMFSAPGILELTYNWGSESDQDFQPHNGNETPKGYGHICIAVPDIEAACQRFCDLGVPFQKKLGEGGIKEIAFIRDPDGYWIEIVQPDLLAQATGVGQ